MDSEEFLAAAREYRSWSEDRMEAELRRLASERGWELALTDGHPDGWHATMTQRHEALGDAVMAESNAQSGSRHEAMENLLLMLRFD